MLCFRIQTALTLLLDPDPVFRHDGLAPAAPDRYGIPLDLHIGRDIFIAHDLHLSFPLAAAFRLVEYVLQKRQICAILEVPLLGRKGAVLFGTVFASAPVP